MTGTGELFDELRRQVVVRRPLCRTAALRGWNEMPATSASSTSRRASSTPSVPLGLMLPRSLTVTGRPEPSCAALATATAVSGSLISAAPAPVFITFGTGQPMFRSMMLAPACAACAAALRMMSGSCPKSWIDTGPSSGCTRATRSCVFWLP